MSSKSQELAERFARFSVRVIRFTGAFPRTYAARKIGEQLLRSAMSVGANYEEARGAESSDDFVHKMSVALKEMREARYWVYLATEANLIPTGKADSLLDEATQLRAILAKSVATARGTTKPKSDQFAV